MGGQSRQDLVNMMEAQNRAMDDQNKFAMADKKRIRELELLLADAHIIEMHPEFHGRCIKKIKELELDNQRLTNLNKASEDEY